MATMHGRDEPPAPAPLLFAAERGWRSRPNIAPSEAGVVVGRWSGFVDRPEEHASAGDPDHYTIGLPLRPTAGSLYVGKKLLLRGRAFPGWVQITRPCEAARIEFETSYDQLHLFVGQRLLFDSFEELYDRAAPTTLELGGRGPIFDATMEQLGRALDRVERSFAELEAVAAEELVTMLLERLLQSYSTCAGLQPRPKAGLPTWRLKRALEFVDGHIDGKVSLSDMATAAGLSRMHFAAQFRAATGMRPHHYLAHRRVQTAETLMRRSDMPLAQVALSVGFKNQSHFTTVFQRLTGQTPRRWQKGQG